MEGHGVSPISLVEANGEVPSLKFMFTPQCSALGSHSQAKDGFCVRSGPSVDIAFKLRAPLCAVSNHVLEFTAVTQGALLLQGARCRCPHTRLAEPRPITPHVERSMTHVAHLGETLWLFHCHLEGPGEQVTGVGAER